nr:hypothetical protein HUO10_000585 [Paraburkholderia busanensis]
MQYNRTVSGDPLDELITLSSLSDDLRHSSLWDARLFTLWQGDTAQPPNASTQSSLSGMSLRSDGVDAGWSVELHDVEGRVFWSQDSRGTVTRTEFDVLGRPVAVYEQLEAADERVAERLIYGDSDISVSAGPEDDNLRGELVRHYDAAGMIAWPGFTLLGAPTGSAQQLLPDAEGQSDWQGDDEGAWQASLAKEIYTSATQYDALGAPLVETDARGNQKRFEHDIAGAVCQCYVKLAGSDVEHMLLSSVSYSAAGQMLQETAGNGVMTQYVYESQTQRLVGVTTTRPASDARETQLQNLSYQYDPVGNILSISNSAQEIRYFRNQAVAAENTYSYDALYQLLSATGRENISAVRQGPALPEPAIDTANVRNYTRNYTYDRGGNLYQIVHSADNNAYTNTLFVDAGSNRALAQDENGSITQSNIGTYFDARGNVRQMQPGKPLNWNGRNQLQSVVLLDRGGTADANDRDVYQYRGSTRVRKQTRTATNVSGNIWQVDEVIYLPGLELRTTSIDENGSVSTSESLQVVTTQIVGRPQVRVLHWEAGQPSDIPNDQIRYSFDNQIGSVMLELDAEANIITQEEYYPYGGTAVLSASSKNEVKYKVIRYSGKEMDGTGLYYYGIRYYSAWTCRWLNPDPAGMRDGSNLYRMAANNPVKYLDPAGDAPITKEEACSYYKYMSEARLELKKMKAALDAANSKTKMGKAVGANAASLAATAGGGTLGAAAGSALGTLIFPGVGTAIGGAVGGLVGKEVVKKIDTKVRRSKLHYSVDDGRRRLEAAKSNAYHALRLGAFEGGGLGKSTAKYVVNAVEETFLDNALPVNPVDIGGLVGDARAGWTMNSEKIAKLSEFVDEIEGFADDYEGKIYEFLDQPETSSKQENPSIHLPGTIGEYTLGLVKGSHHIPGLGRDTVNEATVLRLRGKLHADIVAVRTRLDLSKAKRAKPSP